MVYGRCKQKSGKRKDSICFRRFSVMVNERLLLDDWGRETGPLSSLELFTYSGSLRSQSLESHESMNGLY